MPIAFQRLPDFARLMRLDRPIGTLLLLWPTLWSLWFAAGGMPDRDVLVIFVLIPLVVLTGLTMSPQVNAAWPWLLELFGGRQSARSVHFLCAMGFAAFIVVHLLMVVLAGPFNELRSMLTGWYRLPSSRSHAAKTAA